MSVLAYEGTSPSAPSMRGWNVVLASASPLHSANAANAAAPTPIALRIISPCGSCVSPPESLAAESLGPRSSSSGDGGASARPGSPERVAGAFAMAKPRPDGAAPTRGQRRSRRGNCGPRDRAGEDRDAREAPERREQRE